MRLAFLFILAACGAEPAKAPATPSSPPPAATSPSAADVQCSATPAVFPTFDRTCSTKADCAIAVHQLDCCGTTNAFGIATRVKPQFDAAERTCKAQYHLCACAAQETVESLAPARPGHEILVDCVAGSCRASP